MPTGIEDLVHERVLGRERRPRVRPVTPSATLGGATEGAGGVAQEKGSWNILICFLY